MNKLIIDRFEGQYAVCEKENKVIVNIPKNQLPEGIKEGDHLIIQDDGSLKIDMQSTADQKKRIREKMNRLFE